jgi:sterol desaturase/sphingolipid hydroxylase (fatty acid hydroxylase superfamily)
MLTKFFLVLFLFILFGFFEHFFPAQPNQSMRGRFRNVLLTSIYLFGGFFITYALYSFISIPAKPLPNYGTVVSILVLFAYIFVADFIFYWYHRAQHTFKSFWVIHELHHSDSELNATTSMRSYLFEYPLQFFLIAIPVGYFIGINSNFAPLLAVILTTWLLFTHTNIKLHLGPFSKFICGPQVHRIHHSNLPEHQDKNFAQFFPIIDVIFGTYYHPHKNEFPTTGTIELKSDAPLQTILLKPFRTWFKAN